MTNAVLPFDRPARSASLHPVVAFTAIWAGVSASLLAAVHGLDYWFFSANVPAPRNPEELLAMADRLSEDQPRHAADPRAAGARKGGDAS